MPRATTLPFQAQLDYIASPAAPPELSRIVSFAAFADYAAPTYMGRDLTREQLLQLHQSRQLLFPSATEGTTRWSSLTSGALRSLKLVALSYAWLVKHTADSHSTLIWDQSIFAQAPRNVAMAETILLSFEKAIGSISDLDSWKYPYKFLSTEVPTCADGVYSGAFSDLPFVAPHSAPAPLPGFRGVKNDRVFPPLDTLYDSAVFLSVVNPDRFNKWPPAADPAVPPVALAVPPPLAAVLPKAAAPAPPQVPAELSFTHHLLDFTIPSSSPAGLWLQANLPATDLALLYNTHNLPQVINGQLHTIAPGSPVLDHRGFPWFTPPNASHPERAGTMCLNMSQKETFRASQGNTRDFYNTGHIPPLYCERVATAQYPLLADAVFSGMADLTDDEAEPSGPAYRPQCRPEPIPLFTGLNPTLDFITWIRRVDLQWTVDPLPLSQRTNHVVSRLSGTAAEHWLNQQKQVLSFYSASGKYMDDGKPYIPYTAFRKIMATHYAGFTRLLELRAKFDAFERPEDQPIDSYNDDFRLLLADIATFGPEHVDKESSHISAYLRNCNLLLPVEYLTKDDRNVPWPSLDILMIHARAAYTLQVKTLAAKQGLNTLPHGETKVRHRSPLPGASRQPPAHAGRQQRPSRQQQQQQRGRSRSRSPVSAKSSRSAQGLIASLQSALAAFQSGGNNRRDSRSRSPAGRHVTFSDRPTNRHSRPSNSARNWCEYCNRGYHPLEKCFKKQADEEKKPQHFPRGRQ
jgi:hypothetical protein